MRIAQIAPLYECVPPKLYGGTERIVSYLTEELVRQGHQVSLFASGDSKTSAKLVPCCDTAIRLNPSIHDDMLRFVKTRCGRKMVAGRQSKRAGPSRLVKYSTRTSAESRFSRQIVVISPLILGWR
jgi:hypothetical protein